MTDVTDIEVSRRYTTLDYNAMRRKFADIGISSAIFEDSMKYTIRVHNTDLVAAANLLNKLGLLQ